MSSSNRQTRAVALSLGLRREEAARLLGISTSTLVRLVARGECPAPRKIGQRTVAWSRIELETFFESRPVSDLPSVPRGAA